MAPLTDLGVAEAAGAIRRGDTTSIALVEACLARIASTDRELLAWVTVEADVARSAARACDAASAAGRPSGPLHGVPLGIKDIIDVAGMPTTAGAAAFAHTHPTRDATLVARLRSAGAVILGKTVATEFAFKDPAPTLNPWSADRTPGGSSSGSAAAVAARQVPGAIGTQTVGSILRPAAYCGVVGFKGPHGQIPLDGVVPLAWSLDHAGPIGRSVADIALLQDVLADAPLDTVPIPVPRIAVSRELLDRAEPAMRSHLEAVLAGLAEAGATLEDVDLPPSFAGILEAGRTILAAEAATAHASMFEEHAGEYGPGIASLVIAGRAGPATDLVRADRARAAFRDAIVPLLDGFDGLASPVAPGPAPLRREGTGDFSLCAPWSFIGVPAIAIPTGIDETGLPLAMQLVGGPGGSARLLGAAAWCERVIGFDARPAGPRADSPA